MNTFGKTIRLFLVEGSTNSLVTAELSNWTGIGIRVPKIRIKEFGGRAEFQKPGVYILIGKGEQNEDQAYIGEAEIIFDRLLSHISQKEFWNEVVFFSSKDKYLNKASIKYLENRLHELAKKADRYKLDQNIPTKSELSEAEQAELEEFLANIKILTSTLGYKIFDSIEETLKPTPIQTAITPTEIPSDSGYFTCKNNQGALALGIPSTEGFVVFKDALFMLENQPSLTESIKLEKEEMINKGLLIIDNHFLRLTNDYVFNSSSRAASMILARSAGGPLEWKTEKGVSLKQLQS